MELAQNKRNQKELDPAEVSDKIAFVRKVYGILTAQLVLTAILITGVQVDEGFRAFCWTNQWLHILAVITAISTMIAIICCCGRSYPINMVLCAIFTLAEGYCVAGFTSVYEPELVVTAGVATALVSIALTIYAFYTKTDINTFMAMAFIVYLAMLPMLLFGGFVMGMRAAYMVYCTLGLLLYSLFLIIDTKMIADSGNSFGGFAVAYDDYVIGAMQLYLDIIMIFVYILSIMGAGGGGD